jgi:membrane protease YdiL (CAAX protease family)
VTAPSAPLDGSWERPGRSPLAGGITGLLLCGALYSTLGSLVLGVIVVVMLPSLGGISQGSGLVDLLLEYYRAFRVPILAVTMVMEVLLFFVLVTALVRRWHSSRPLAFLSFRRPRALDLVLAGIGAVAIVPLAELIDRLSSLLLPQLKELSSGQDALLSAGSVPGLVLVVAAVSLTPALCEETLFRGWLQGSLRRKLGALPTIIIQAVLFSLFHMSPLSIVALAFVGLYLGFLFDRCGTLFASMTAHGLYNGTIIALVNLHPAALLDSSGSFSVPVLAVSAAVTAGAVLAVELRHRRTPSAPAA